MVMKKTQLVSLLLILGLAFVMASPAAAQSSVKRKLKKIAGVVSVEELPGGQHKHSKYLILFEQPVDHTNPAAGTFRQRLFLLHEGFDRPMVFTTEGYSAEYANRPDFRDELTELFEANQIVVEHRYFGKSVPEGAGWDPLTVENAAADHHRVVQAFHTLYDKKWISTGISKGGSTALIHKVLYPDDVDITIPYVAPLNFGVEDGRHESFVATNGSPELRNSIIRFQTQVLSRRPILQPMLANYIEKSNLTYKIPLAELFDYLVLEYAFSCYQWGWKYDAIPADTASDMELFLHFVMVSSPDYFAKESYEDYLPFFIQASRQLGYYGYEIRPYYDLMKIQSTKGYLKRIFLPDSIQYAFDVSISDRIQQYLFTSDPKMIFIYGEWDPWSASAVVFDSREKQQMLKVVCPQGSHLTRISTLPEDQKELVIKRIKGWLGED